MYVQRTTMAHSRIIVTVEKQEVLYICLCVRARARACMCGGARQRERVHARARSLTSPARNAYAPCDVIYGLWIHHIFLHYLKNGTIFEKKLLNIKYVFLFSLQLCM